jgi:hypothetical protein
MVALPSRAIITAPAFSRRVIAVWSYLSSLGVEKHYPLIRLYRFKIRLRRCDCCASRGLMSAQTLIRHVPMRRVCVGHSGIQAHRRFLQILLSG